MRIEVGDPSRCAALRDYFLRLGAMATVGERSTVDVSFPDDPINAQEDIEAYLRSWVEINGVAATVAPRTARGTSVTIGAPLLNEDAAPRLGDLLVAKGFITPEQLAYAVVEARKQGELLGRLLLRYEWIFESELARTLAEQWGLPYLNLQSIGVDRKLVELLPSDIGARAAAIPVRRMSGGTQVAFADPTDPAALEAVRDYIPSFVPAVAELSDIKNAWRLIDPPAKASSEPEPEQAPEVAQPASNRPKIGELFVSAGLVTPADLESALREQKTSRKPLGEILVMRGLIDRLDLASTLSRQWTAQRTLPPQPAAPAISSEAKPLRDHEPAPGNQPEAEQKPEPAYEPDHEPKPEPELVEQIEAETPESDPQVAQLLQAVLELTATVERLRAEIEMLGAAPAGRNGHRVHAVTP
jgi:hypothetical protein